MADYRDLLRRAVEALPENNGNARRQVYDKARKALRNQLDAIQPELPSREKTFHRLQLEECIREVEHEATERILGGFTQFDNEALHLDREVRKASPDTPKAPEANSASPKTESVQALASADDEPKSASRESDAPGHSKAEAVEKIAAQASAKEDAVVAEADSDDKLVAADMPERRPAVSAPEPAAGKGSTIEDVIREAQTSVADADMPAGKSSKAPSAAPGSGRTEALAMSSVREVELDGADDSHADSQSKIDRAIAMLDREASGEGGNSEIHSGPSGLSTADPATADMGFAKGELEEESSSGSALAIFLVVFVLLLAGVGGAGYWAWREGYVDLGGMFGQAGDNAALSATTKPDSNSGATAAADTASAANADHSGPGNTAATPLAVDSSSAQLGKGGSENAVETPVADTSAVTNVETPVEPVVETLATADAAADNSTKIVERLPTDIAANDVASADGAAVDGVQPEVVAEGGQSLLLEASDQGTTGALPYSGSVEWVRGADELGQPTLIGKAKIPARNLGVNVLIRKNSDPTLPASHLMEIDFEVSDTFVGGGIARIAGVLLKNEELVQGVPLVGASARVVGSSFLFALSAATPDETANKALLRSRKWIDLAMIYSTGKQAIITLEKDAAAQKLFDDVMNEWDAIATTN